MTQAAISTPTRSAGSQPVVIAQRLTKTFKDFWRRDRVRAVDSVDFHIDRGEIFGLLGPNGSGKSTTIKILLGLLHKTSGRVEVLGKLPQDVAVKRRIGYLPEESYLYPFLNARETLDYYGKLFKLSGRERSKRIDELLDMVGLTAVQYRPVREYSKGMQRRIGIAQALINDPELLILDEPTTGLDPIGTRQVKDLILELGRRGKTVLLSSHLLADVEDCVDRMVILYGGKIQREGTCNELLEAQDRSIIETDSLDDDTISELDRVLRERTGGARSITRVAHPRQKLEELFMEIVEDARQQQLTTSGAMHGGGTASFLQGGDGSTGERLVDQLVQAGTTPDPAQQTPEAPAEAAGPDESVLDDLIAQARPEAPQPEQSPEATTDRPTVPENVDRGIIGSLLGDEDAAEPGDDADDPERRA